MPSQINISEDGGLNVSARPQIFEKIDAMDSATCHLDKMIGVLENRLSHACVQPDALRVSPVPPDKPSGDSALITTLQGHVFYLNVLAGRLGRIIQDLQV